MTIRRSGRVALATALAPIVTACATAGPEPGPVPRGGPAAVGSYAGSVVIDGQTFGATLTLRASESMAVARAFRLDGVLRIPSPVEIEGAVDGIAIDDIVRLRVEYRSVDGCDGRIEGILDVTRDGDALDGPVTVADCGEPVAGRLTLRRRGVRQVGDSVPSLSAPPEAPEAPGAIEPWTKPPER